MEKRDSARHPVVRDRALLAWETDEGHGHVRARFLNLSQSGALLVADRAFNEGETVWVRLEEIEDSPWHEATVIKNLPVISRWFQRPKPGPPQVRIKFCSPCSYDFFKLATQRVQSKEPPADRKPTASDRVIWR